MRALTLFALLLALHASAYATNISGLISGNTTWTKANSPYVISGHLLVDSNATLTIEPGVEIQITPQYDFFIEGNIVAIGTPTDSIILIPNKSLQYPVWKQMKFRATSTPKTGIFKYCSFQGKGMTIDMALNTELTVSYCTFIGKASAIFMFNKITITHNKFVNCGTALYNQGAWLTGEISNNEFSYCDRAITGACRATIKNNYIHDNRGESIVIETMDAGEISNNIFYNNRTGIYIRNATLVAPIHNNVFANNKVGLRLFLTKGTVKHNTIKHNETGVVINARPVDPCSFEYNCLDSNTLSVKLEGWNDANLKDNYWGSTDTAAIDSKMWDYDQDFASGFLSFTPILMQADSSCQAIVLPGDTTTPTRIPVPGIEATVVKVYPNPFSSSFKITTTRNDISSYVIYNIVGRTILSGAMDKKETVIDLSNQPNGIYIYRVSFSDGETNTGRVIKQ